MTIPDPERAAEEAAEWLVLLAEEPDNPGIRTAFDAWCAMSRINAEMWARMARAYDLVGQGQPKHRPEWDVHERPDPPALKLPRGATARRRIFRLRDEGDRAVRKRAARTVATGAVAAALAAAFLPTFITNLQSDYVTGTAESRTVALADGSKVRLGPQTAIAVDFGGKGRSIRILKGDAWFDVAHDPSRPFRVGSRDAEVTVLGTAFNVRQDEEDTKVAVQRGHVRVEHRGVTGKSAFELLAGDFIAVGGTATAIREHVAAVEVGDRTRGTLVVRDRPVSEIVDALRPWYAGVIVVRGARFAQWRVSGLYDLRDPVDTLTTLAGQHGGRIRQITPWLLVVTAD